ncbi:MAG: hypothetical protein ACFE0J_04800 [Elainellaceae cyanobacterium]
MATLKRQLTLLAKYLDHQPVGFKAAKGEMRVVANGFPCTQANSRLRLMAVAVMTC